MLDRNNQNGFAIVYGLIALFLTTIGGLSFLYISGKDKESAMDYMQMRDATFASRAAHSAFMGLCKTNPNFVIKQIETYVANNSKQWLFGNTINDAGKENKIPLWSESSTPAFSAKIINYNPSTFTVEIEARGYGRLGGRKKSYGTYKLKGLKKEVLVTPSHALYLGGGIENIDAPFSVYGNTFTDGRIHANGNGGLIISGDFKTGTSLYSSDAALTILGKAFFRGSVKFQRTEPVFNGKVGILGNIETDVNININGDFFFNGSTISGNNGLVKVGSGYTATYKSDIDASKIKADHKVATDSTIHIASALQMTNASDQPPEICQNLEGTIQNSGGTIYTPSDANIDFNTYGWDLNSAYSNNSKWNDFLVIKVSSNNNMNINAKGGTFNGKAIWIIDGIDCPAHSKWYSSGNNSNTLIYLKNDASLTEFGFGESKSFRGVIYSESDKVSSFTFGKDAILNGSIISAGNIPVKFQGFVDYAEIKYDKSVAEEFTNIGLFKSPIQDESSSQKIILNDIHIRPYLVSMSF